MPRRPPETTVHITSLGCAKNQVDSEVMAARLERAGMRLVDDPAAAHVILINTCTFIEDATQESVDTILELARYKKSGICRRLVVGGCLAQRYADELQRAMPEIDGLLGVAAIDSVVETCCEADRALRIPPPEQAPLDGLPRVDLQRGPSAYIKISEGCSRRCAFCIIPRLRGPLRSRSIESIDSEVRALVQRGVKEIDLVGQDTSAYGRDRPGRERLPDLLEALNRIDDLVWIRVLYAYPAHFGTRLMQAIATLPRVCRYVDVPLQHVDDRVLRDMGRWTSERTVRTLVDRLRARIPGVALRTTFLVGFPGETEQQFQRLLDFVAEARFERMGAFAFSPEEGTEAATMPNQVPEPERQARLEALLALQSTIHQAHNRSLVGTRQTVLVEGWEGGPLLVGRTEHQAPEVDGVVILDGGDAEPGQLIEAEVTGTDGLDLIAVPVDP